MSKADEMLKKLGYEKVVDNYKEILYKRLTIAMGEKLESNLLFAKITKLIGNDHLLDMQELQAINEKVKELRVDRMSKEEAIEHLAKYIKEDNIYSEWKNNNKIKLSDFDMYCINHCQAIETVLNILEETKNQQKRFKKYKEDFEKLHEGIYEMLNTEKENVEEELENTKANEYECNNRINDLLDEIKERDKIIDLMAEEIFLKRCYALAGTKSTEEEIEDWKDKIIKEYEEKVENEN